jgi:hypothetical protein
MLGIESQRRQMSTRKRHDIFDAKKSFNVMERAAGLPPVKVFMNTSFVFSRLATRYE